MAKKAVSAVRPTARDLSPDGQIDNLKTLNTLLIEETIERRKQVAQLQSELDELYLVNSIERDVFQLVLSSTVAGLEVGLAAERAAVAETVGVLQMKVESAAAALGVTEMCLLAAAGEKDLIMREVEDKRIETGNLGAECAKLQNKVRDMERRLGLVIQENASLKICIDEKISSVDKSGRDLLSMEMLKLKEAEIEILNADKKAYVTKVSALKEECHHLNAVQRNLEDETSRFKCLVDELKEDELGWRMKYEEMEQSHLMVGKELSDIRIQLGQLEKEKFKNETFHLKFEEMISLIDDLKGNIVKAEAEKDVLDQRRVELEIDSCNLKNELVELHSVRKSLEDANLAYSEANAKVEAVNVAAQNQLKLEEEENSFLRLQVEKLLENKHFLGRKCEQLQVDLNRGTSKNRKKSRQIDSLLAANASHEKKLEMTFGQVLSLVRNIAAEEAQENQYRITEEKMEYDEMIQSLEKELEAIKFALKSRNTKIEDLNRELELLRISMVDAQKSKEGLWKWLCPATTTIVAAVSLAYAARAR